MLLGRTIPISPEQASPRNGRDFPFRSVGCMLGVGQPASTATLAGSIALRAETPESRATEDAGRRSRGKSRAGCRTGCWGAFDVRFRLLRLDGSGRGLHVSDLDRLQPE